MRDAHDHIGTQGEFTEFGRRQGHGLAYAELQRSPRPGLQLKTRQVRSSTRGKIDNGNHTHETSA